MKKDIFRNRREATSSGVGADELKRHECSANGVLLIEVPELDVLMPVSELRSFIKEKLIEEGREIPNDFDEMKVNLDSIRTVGRLSELRKVAKDKGGECLSRSWLGAKRNHRFVVPEGMSGVLRHIR